jgi:hypothetical protein
MKANEAKTLNVEKLAAGQYFVVAKNSQDQIVHLNFLKR